MGDQITTQLLDKLYQKALETPEEDLQARDPAGHTKEQFLRKIKEFDMFIGDLNYLGIINQVYLPCHYSFSTFYQLFELYYYISYGEKLV